MSGNSIGKLFQVTTWGESHGPALGAVIDGCPPGIELSEAYIQKELNRRRPVNEKLSLIGLAMFCFGYFIGKKICEHIIIKRLEA